MNLHAVDTLVPEKQPKKFYRVGSIGHFVYRHIWLLQDVYKMPNDRKNFET